MDVPRGQAVARLCDVAPDGSSTLVTRGVLNLAARHGRDRTDDWTPGDTEDVTFDLNGIGHTFPPGHRIRLAVSSRVLALDLAAGPARRASPSTRTAASSSCRCAATPRSPRQLRRTGGGRPLGW
ncbi:hypothetical protein SMICM304S_03682 [Streptomyces microflavus]